MTSLPALSAKDRHFARRFSSGIDVALATQIRQAGGGRDWFARQLKPSAISDSVTAKYDTWFPSVKWSAQEILKSERDGNLAGWEVMWEFSRWTMMRRMKSPRHVYEQMVDFWSNLLHVPLMKDDALFHRTGYDRVIRAHAMGRFDNMLVAAITHPAMGLHLNNAESTKDAPNENLGRELLELFTVGVDGGYTEDHVKACSRMLTGYAVPWPNLVPVYKTSWHDTRPVQVLGFKHTNSNPDGRAATEKMLRYLAKHPATAKRIAHRLCQRFVTDEPPRAMVDALAKVYLASETAIVPVLRALVARPEFAASIGKKVRTPTEDYLATVKALRINIARPTSDESFAHSMTWQCRDMGMSPYEWPAPNGYPEDSRAWLGAGRFLSAMVMHRALGYGWWPNQQVTYRPHGDWLPPLPATLGDVITHVGYELLGQKPAARSVAGVALAMDKPVTFKVTSAWVNRWNINALLIGLLDTPVHLKR